MTIAIVDYGMGNLRSVAKALEHVAPQERVVVTDCPEVIARARRLVFPGQGAIGGCIRALDARGLREPLTAAAKDKPLLGICLGPQALLEYSEENGGVACLGLLPGQVKRFPPGLADANGQRLKVPHMGWSQVAQRQSHPLWQGIPNGSRFYFVHSYYLAPDETLWSGATHYGLSFAAAVARDNLFAVQFHPEKSASTGLRLLANFTRWEP